MNENKREKRIFSQTHVIFFYFTLQYYIYTMDLRQLEARVLSPSQTEKKETNLPRSSTLRFSIPPFLPFPPCLLSRSI